MEISIIIPSFLRSELLKLNLLALSNQYIPYKFETIILNDGLQDDTHSVCEPYIDKLNLKYIFSGKRNLDGKLIWRTPGFAINIGVKQSFGNVIVLCCAEIFHVNNSVQLLTNVYETNRSDKIVAIPKAKDDNGRFLKHLMETGGDYNIEEYNKQPPLDNVKFPFFVAMKKKEFVDIGGYDEDFIGTDFDDTDFVRRLIQNGCSYAETDAKIIHLWHPRLPMTHDRKIRYDYNKKLYSERENIIIRNVGKDWGVL